MNGPLKDGRRFLDAPDRSARRMPFVDDAAVLSVPERAFASEVLAAGSVCEPCGQIRPGSCGGALCPGVWCQHPHRGSTFQRLGRQGVQEGSRLKKGTAKLSVKISWLHR